MDGDFTSHWFTVPTPLREAILACLMVCMESERDGKSRVTNNDVLNVCLI